MGGCNVDSCKGCEWYGFCPHSYAEWDEEHSKEVE